MNIWSRFVTGSRRTIRLKVIFVARLPQILGARSRSVPIKDVVTAVACRYAASARAPTPAPGRARANPSPARKRPSNATRRYIAPRSGEAQDLWLLQVA